MPSLLWIICELCFIILGNSHSPKSPRILVESSQVSTFGCDNDWSYAGLNGPHHWSNNYPICGTGTSGERQSPIDIRFPSSDRYESNPFIPDLKLISTMIKPNSLLLKNNGRSLQMSFPPDNVIQISGGYLNATYKLAELYFHWGMDNKHGSEHFVNGHQFPLELQFIYWNTGYDNFKSAYYSKGGLVIVSVLFVLGEENSELTNILRTAIPDLISLNSKTYFDHNFLITNLFPPTFTSQWISYEGSLTMPPCFETVTWIFPKETMTIHPFQLVQIRKIASDKKRKIPIAPNYRPIQYQNGREIIISFKPLNNYDFILTLTKKPGCWSEARADCMSQGGDLASITSHAEQTKILAACSGYDDEKYFWIGLKKKIGVAGQRDDWWYWVDGTESKNYNKWSNKGTNNNLNYGVMNASSFDGRWYDSKECPTKGLRGVCMIPRSIMERIYLEKEQKISEQNKTKQKFLN